MGILIKDLEMPEDGALLCLKIYPSGVVRTCFGPPQPPESKIATAIPISGHGDTISKQGVIDALEENKEMINASLDSLTLDYSIRRNLEQRRGQINEDIETIKELSSAEPMYGKWIKATGMMPPEFHGRHCCSECGNFANMKPPFGNREDLSKFCPNCGARMKRSEE